VEVIYFVPKGGDWFLQDRVCSSHQRSRLGRNLKKSLCEVNQSDGVKKVKGG